MKIVNHYLSDILIRKIIEKYPNNFENIKLSYKNVYDIFNKKPFFNSEDAIKNILELKEKFNTNNNSFLELNKNENKIKIEEIFNNIKDKNQIYAKSPIFINDKQISVIEMNFLLEFLFSIKFEGKIIANLNISFEEPINLKQENIDLDKIGHIFNSLNANKNENFNGSTSNEKEIIINKIIEVIFKDIKGIIEKDFNETLIKKDINIVDILNCIINNEFNNLFLVNQIFERELLLDINEFIKNFDVKIQIDEKNLVEEYIQRINNDIEIISEKEKEYHDFKIDINDKIYKKIKEFIIDSFNDNLFQSKEGINQLKNEFLFMVNKLSKNLETKNYKGNQ